MSQRTDAQLTTEKDIIENETTEGANTKTRVGDMLENIIDSKINNDKIETASTLDTSGKTVAGRDAVKSALNSKQDVFATQRDVSGAHTLDATDLGHVNNGENYVLNNTTSGVLTLPLNATVDFPEDTFIRVPGFTTVAIAGGGTLNGTNGTLNVVGDDCYVRYLGSDTWTLYNGEPDASETVKGLVELATTAEVVTGTDTVRAATAAGVKAAIDAAVVGLWDDRGVFDASGGAYPSSGGSGTAGAILKGDIWTISVAGTLPTGQVVEIGDTVRALTDTPGNTQANWAIQQNNIGYVAENAANKATGFGTLNNTLYPTTQAVATYVATLTGGGYTDVAYVNTFSGVDPTGATDSKTGLQAAMASGKKVIVFDGLYRTTDILTLNTGQTVLIRGGTVITLYGNVNTGDCLFVMADRSHILAESGARLTHTPTGTASYTGIRASSKYLWSIDGKLTIDGFGNNGIRVQGTGSGNNGYKNGFIRGVICQSNINNGFGGTHGHGHGIRIDAGAEYLLIVDVECYENQGFGILNLGGANNPIINTKLIKNTLGGLRILGDSVNNTDHFHVLGCQINHNDAVNTYNVWISDVDTGVNFDGGSIYGGATMKVENSRGISFNGMGLSISGANHVSPGAIGDGLVKITGGHVIGSGTSIEGFKTALVGGGMVVFENVLECQLATSYSSAFTAGVDSWTDTGVTSTGNIDSITDGTTSFSDTLRVAGDGNNSTHLISRATTLTVGNKYKISITVYMPSANTNIDGIRLTDSGGLSQDFDYLRAGKWVTVEKDFTALGTTLQISLLDGTSDTFTAPTGDFAYIGRILLFAR